ncbi:murein hydrolase activator EnvC [Oceanicella sp. SM1341]|uniref:murein hydrolase activator EnvC family protein n=1 Tax=Oceanicella sp. SM1341 TaxID=1548889 RepID=UPI000E4E8978|nr:peptidoglycan DD-metalloendopeptidase family protein [Oceanicella sp. SM1341]
MRRARAFALGAAVLLGWAGATAAQEDPIGQAGRAADRVAAAAAGLAAARGADNRLAAYGQAVQAYEAGLAAVRDGMRALSGRVAELQARIDSRSDELSNILGLLQIVERSPTPVQLLHPSGPLGAARAAHLMADISPALESELIQLQTILAEMEALRESQEKARETLRAGLAGVQNARAALAEAMSARSPGPAPDPGEAEALRSGAISLRDFAQTLRDAPGGGVADSHFAAAKGSLHLPVAGRLLRRFGQKDASGLARPGIILQAPAHAIVTTPWRATLRYAGEFLDYGEIAILEPQEGYLLILAGLGSIDRRVGEVLEKGEPVGTLGGLQPDAEEFLIDGTAGNREIRSETLYMELRIDGEPVDPTTWFGLAPEQEGSQ